LQQSLNIGFEQCSIGGFAGIVVNHDRVALEIAHKLLCFLFSWKVAPVATRMKVSATEYEYPSSAKQ
jgi:hypothetical protein